MRSGSMTLVKDLQVARYILLSLQTVRSGKDALSWDSERALLDCLLGTAFTSPGPYVRVCPLRVQDGSPKKRREARDAQAQSASLHSRAPHYSARGSAADAACCLKEPVTTIEEPAPSSAMAGRTRCIIMPNKRDLTKDAGKLVAVPSSLDEFLKLASEKLNVSAKRAFTENGVIVDDVSLIRDDERIFISSGEAFWKYDDAKVRTYKVAVLGAGGVGKSCLSLRYVKNSFVDVYDPTIEDAFRHQTVIDGQTCLLDILDTAGQEDMKMLRRQWVQDRDGFLLVYSMTEKRSFDELEHFLSLIRSIKVGKQVPLVIVANKSDLKDQRTVSESEGRSLANQNGGEYIEASARMGDNISESFELLVRKWNSIDNVSTPNKPPKTSGKPFCVLV